jgi:hypothetical protein
MSGQLISTLFSQLDCQHIREVTGMIIYEKICANTIQIVNAQTGANRETRHSTATNTDINNLVSQQLLELLEGKK